MFFYLWCSINKARISYYLMQLKFINWNNIQNIPMNKVNNFVCFTYSKIIGVQAIKNVNVNIAYKVMLKKIYLLEIKSFNPTHWS